MPETQILLSNQTEILYESLKAQLFNKNTDPFTTRLVVVPSKAMKSWLSLKLAEDLGIASGIEFLFLEPAMKRLQKSLADPNEALYQLPSRMELSLKIEKEIRLALKNDTHDIWDPLRHHLLDRKRKKILGKGEKRLASLADHLAGLFAQYEKYGRRMLNRWLKDEPKDWQEVLWRKVVGTTGPDTFLWRQGNAVVHLFALSYISMQQHRMLCSLSSTIPVNYYLLSPCRVFWSDLLSDRENSRLIHCWQTQGMSQESLAEATELLFERNPLLANWGKLGRLMAAQIEETVSQTEDEYYENDTISTVLHALQNDLLNLQNGKFSETRTFTEDQSIQIHVSLSKTREIQALYQTLLGIIHKHSKGNEKIEPYDIVVMAPDIKEYEPLIKAVFQSPESVLDCQIMDLNLLDQNDVVKGFFHLLQLPDSRWDNESVLNLFSYASFQEKQGLSQSEVDKIGKWVRETGIRWGIDARQRSELLMRSHCERGMLDKSAAGTWRMGIDRLLLGTAMILPTGIEDKARFSRRPILEVSSAEQELLGEWSLLMKNLQEDLKPISTFEKKPLGEWSEYLLYLLHRYFSWNAASDEDKTQIAALVKSIESLKAVSSGLKDYYPFATVLFHLKKTLEQQEVHYRESHFQAVRFCSMLPMRAVPAKVVVMIGLSEEKYPRKEDKMILNQLYRQKDVDPFPSTTEFDRYLFLEAVLSARQYLILSYYKKDQGAKGLHECSLLISELMHYLDHSFSIDHNKPSEALVYQHPFHSFDKSYFEQKGKIRSYSQTEYLAAMSYYRIDKKGTYAFIPKFRKPHQTQEIQSITTKELKRLARNPFEFYFQKRLGIFLKEEKEAVKEEALAMTPLDLSRFRKESWCVPIETLLRIADLEGLIPVGPFRQLAIDKIVQESFEIAEHMKQFSLEPEEIFELSLCETCAFPVKEGNRWIFPPLIIALDSGPIHIQGTLGEGSHEGLIIHKKGEKRDLVEAWPLFLIWCRLIETYALPAKKEILFLRSGKRYEAWFTDSLENLKQYLNYYSLATQEISPLLPDWTEAFLSADEEKVEKVVNESLKGNYFWNEEVKWVCRDQQVLNSAEMCSEWSSVAEALFSEMNTQWSDNQK